MHHFWLWVVFLLLEEAVLSWDVAIKWSPFSDQQYGVIIHGVDVLSAYVHRNISNERYEVPGTSPMEDLEYLLDNRWIIYFPNQVDFSASDQVAFGALFGDLHPQSSDRNRPQDGEKRNPYVAIFSNNPEKGAVNVGIEGFHVDGNVAPVPHRYTMIYCEEPVEGGDTLFVSLYEVYHRVIERKLVIEGGQVLDWREVMFRSGHVSTNVHPLIFPHPSTGIDTVMVALGKLSASRYAYNTEEGMIELSENTTSKIIECIEDAINEVGVYAHRWKKGDLLVIDNMAVAHFATPGTQDRSRGDRVMRRVNVQFTSIRAPQQRSYPLYKYFPHVCDKSLCLVSLSQFLNERAQHSNDDEVLSGVFNSVNESRRLCKFLLHKTADLASIENPSKNDMAAQLISQTGVPHWLNAHESSYHLAWLNGATDSWTSHPWHESSGQPNDCSGPGSEPCVFIGPYGKWFDFACAPKTGVNETPGPEITWEDDKRRMYNIYPLCQVDRQIFGYNSQGDSCLENTQIINR